MISLNPTLLVSLALPSVTKGSKVAHDVTPELLNEQMDIPAQLEPTPEKSVKIVEQEEDNDDEFVDALDTFGDEIVVAKSVIEEQSLQKVVQEEDDDDDYFDAPDTFEDEMVVQKQAIKTDEELPTDEQAPVTLFTQDEYNSFYGVKPDEESLTFLEKSSAFLNSVVGSKLVQTGKAMLGENVGMMVGAAFPEATIAFEAAKHATNSSKAGIAAALTVTALTTSLSYLTGTPMEYGRALGYMVTAAGTIAGGMGGLETMGQEVPDGYIPRTAAYLAATGVVGTVANGVSTVAEHIPLPLVSTATNVVGKAATTVAGMAAYYGPESVVMAERMMNPKPQDRNLFDPGEFTQNVVTNANGDSKAFSEAMAKKLIESPLLASLTRLLIQHSVDRKVATNGLARAMNKFAEHMQNETIQKKIKELRATPDQQRKEDLKKEIATLVAKEYGILETPMANKVKSAADPFIPSLIKQITDLMGKKEVEFFGMTLSNEAQTKDFLEALLPALIPMIGVYTKRELLATKDLSKEEIETFYGNLSAALFAPYNEYMLGRGMQGLVATAIPFMQQYGQFLPSLLSESIGQALAEPVINLDETAPPKVEEPAPKKGVWESIRAKIKLIRYMIQFVGWKKFVQIARAVLLKHFMKKTGVE